MDQPSLHVNRLIGLNITGAILSLLFMILQAEFFGVSREIEVYFIALGLIHILLALLQTNQIGPLFLPVYHRLLDKEGRKEGFRAFSIVINWVAIFTLPFLSIILFGSEWLLNSGWLGYPLEYRSMLHSMVLIMVPTVLFQSLNFIIEIFHAANRNYGRAEFMVALSTTLSIGSLIFWHESLGIWSLVLGWWLGSGIRFLMNIYFLFRLGFAYSFALSSSNFDRKNFFKKVFNSYLFTGSKQLYSLVFLSLVTFLPSGVFAVFKYVENIFLRIQRVVSDPVTTVFYTDYSQALQAKPDESDKILQWGLNRSLLQASVVFIFLFSFKRDLLTSIWDQDIGVQYMTLGAEFMALFALTLVLNNIGVLCQKIGLARNYVKELYSHMAMAQIFNVICIIVAMKYFELEGLKWAIIIMATMQSVAPIIMLIRKKNNPFKQYNFRKMFIGTLMVLLLMGIGLIIDNYVYLNWDTSISRLVSFGNLLIKSCILLLILLTVLQLLGIIKTRYIPSLKRPMH